MSKHTLYPCYFGLRESLAQTRVLPYLPEGLPVGLVEAMFKSPACIASRIEVFKKVITDGKASLLIDPASADKPKDAMIDLYKNADLRKSPGKDGFQQAQT